jgi:DNA-binding Lrp family transcriptional regulator
MFEKAIQSRPQVMECCLMTADADWPLRVAVPGVKSLERFIVNPLSKICDSAGIQPSFELKQVKCGTALALT